ncbi:MAG: DUF302 domain-containing protein [Fimbriimonadaceae bacterium]
MELGFSKIIECGFEEAISRTTSAIVAVGFGIVSDIDVAATFKAKLGVDYRPYRILGACNPGLAKKALDEMPEIGLFIPCNVTVEQVEGGIKVMAIDPLAALAVAGPNAVLEEVVNDARPRLQEAIASL